MLFFFWLFTSFSLFASEPHVEPIVTEAEWVLIAGIKWATRNVDAPGTFAARPEDIGMHYQWNRKNGWSTGNPMVNSKNRTKWNHSYFFGTIWKKAKDPCPRGWRVPTATELESLANTANELTTINGVNGRIFGTDDNILFLPASGFRDNSDGTLYNWDSYGYYWSSSVSLDDVYYLFFGSTTAFTSFSDYAYGFCVRCVAE